MDKATEQVPSAVGDRRRTARTRTAPPCRHAGGARLAPRRTTHDADRAARHGLRVTARRRHHAARYSARRNAARPTWRDPRRAATDARNSVAQHEPHGHTDRDTAPRRDTASRHGPRNRNHRTRHGLRGTRRSCVAVHAERHGPHRQSTAPRRRRRPHVRHPAASTAQRPSRAARGWARQTSLPCRATGRTVRREPATL